MVLKVISVSSFGKVPNVVVNAMGVPLGMGNPAVSNTVAVTAVELTPSFGRLLSADVSVIYPTLPVGMATTIQVVARIELSVARVARMRSPLQQALQLGELTIPAV
jgi:hypothetical protein